MPPAGCAWGAVAVAVCGATLQEVVQLYNSLTLPTARRSASHVPNPRQLSKARELFAQTL